MRTSDVMNQTAAATAGGVGSGLLSLGGAMPGATKATPGSLGLTFDLAAYTQMLQHVTKMYQYDPASLAASLAALSPASHLPLALTAPHALSLTVSKLAAEAGEGRKSPSWTVPKEEPKAKEDDTEGALDLRTQGLKSLYSSYRRASLDDIKPKVVEDIWIENDVSMSWTDSRVVAYNPAQKLFMCLDCECVGFLSRVAEHWLGAHANLRVFRCPRCPYTSAWSRCVKMHLTRQHNEQFADTTMWKENSTLMEVTRIMQELRNKVEMRIDSSNTLADKRFYCPHCPYATDRRDLYTRHENIHKDDKPFHCYLCFKQFNRADHVKKHFVRMHPETDYDISKIRKQPGSGRRAAHVTPPSPPPQPPVMPVETTMTPPRAATPPPVVPPVPSPPVASPAVEVDEVVDLSAPSSPGDYVPASPECIVSVPSPEPVSAVASPSGASSSSPVMMGVTSPSSLGVTSPSSLGVVGLGVGLSLLAVDGEVGRARRRGDRAYTCPYCHWSGSDNWCLKRHMNTHIKPFACVMCDYKAARAERLSTHVWKVHNKRICNKCNFLADSQERLLEHTREEHHNNPYSRRYICSSCGLTFDTRPALETHQHLSHPRLSRSSSTGESSSEAQDVAHDLSIRGEESPMASPPPSPLVCPVEGCERALGSSLALAEHVRGEHGGAAASSCPHCGYQLTHDELSRDHWLTHHSEVCAACVHVFTSVYGPQLWKKVHVRPAALESPLDAIVTGLNRKRTAKDAFPGGAPLLAPLALTVPPQLPQRDTPSPDSDAALDAELERNKRSRKQSCPKKVIAAQEDAEAAGAAGKLRRRGGKKVRRRVARQAFTGRQCHRCLHRPVFTSRARLHVHLQWVHGRQPSTRHPKLRLAATH